MPLSLLYFIVLCSAKCVHPTLRLMCLKYSSFCEQNSRLQTLFRMLIPPVSFVAMLPMYLHLVAPWLRSLLLHCSSQLLPGLASPHPPSGHQPSAAARYTGPGYLLVFGLGGSSQLCCLNFVEIKQNVIRT